MPLGAPEVVNVDKINSVTRNDLRGLCKPTNARVALTNSSGWVLRRRARVNGISQDWHEAALGRLAKATFSADARSVSYEVERRNIDTWETACTTQTYDVGPDKLGDRSVTVTGSYFSGDTHCSFTDG